MWSDSPYELEALLILNDAPEVLDGNEFKLGTVINPHVLLSAVPQSVRLGVFVEVGVLTDESRIRVDAVLLTRDEQLLAASCIFDADIGRGDPEWWGPRYIRIPLELDLELHHETELVLAIRANDVMLGGKALVFRQTDVPDYPPLP